MDQAGPASEACLIQSNSITDLAIQMAMRAKQIGFMVYPDDSPTRLIFLILLIMYLLENARYSEAYDETEMMENMISSPSLRSQLGEEEVARQEWTNASLKNRALSKGGNPVDTEVFIAIQREMLENPALAEDATYSTSAKIQLADCLVKVGKLDEANLMIEELIASAESTGRSVVYRAVYLKMLWSRLFIYLAMKETTPPQNADMGLDKKMADLSVYIHRGILTLKGTSYAHTWETAVCAISLLDKANRVEEVVELTEPLFETAVKRQTTFEGVLFLKFRSCLSVVLTVASRLETRPRRAITALLEQTLDALGILPESVWTTPQLNRLAVGQMEDGQFARAEQTLRHALDEGRREKMSDSLLGQVYYNLAVVIAQQPGRFQEAVDLRTQKAALITPIEAIGGSLEQHAESFAYVLEVYHTAQSKIQAGDSRTGQWWLDNKYAIDQAEALYGFLDEDTAATGVSLAGNETTT